MNVIETEEMSAVISRVKTWLPETQILLVHKILETFEQSTIIKPAKKMSLDQVFGILKTDSPPPNDEECAKIIKEERSRRYG
jgi:hypothetical protein